VTRDGVKTVDSNIVQDNLGANTGSEANGTQKSHKLRRRSNRRGSPFSALGLGLYYDRLHKVCTLGIFDWLQLKILLEEAIWAQEPQL
jgi:hypothetical protein